MTVTSTNNLNLEHLLSELRRITLLVSERVAALRVVNSTEEEDEFRGLYVSEEEVNNLLADPQLFQATDITPHTPGGEIVVEYNERSRLRQLQTAFGLSAFELNVILIALAPELDLRFEKLYAYLQDDVTRRRPTVDLTLQLLCPGLAAQVAARRSFDPEAALLRYRLVELSDESGNKQVPLLARTIKLDEGLIAFLLGEMRLDHRLRQVAEFETRSPNPLLSTEVATYLTRLIELAPESFLCTLVGSDEVIKRDLVLTLCRQFNLPLLVLNLRSLVLQTRQESLARLLERECLMRGAVLYLAGYEVVAGEEANIQETVRAVSQLLKTETVLTFISSNEMLAPQIAGHSRLEFQLKLKQPSYSERKHIWETHLGAAAVGFDLEGLSSRFRLNSGQVVAAAATARNRAAWRGETVPTLDDLETASRVHSSHRLSSLAHKIEPVYRWSDLVLATDPFNMLREICEQVKHRSLVYGTWGFDRKLSLGKGLNVVFAGPSGTGKTMSAEIMAGELKMDLYKIDLSNMVSKFIGETEKNLERIFNEAGDSNAILFFDEADSLFGKRSEVKDAHDRYANIETGYLLQKMEEYDGIVILATNLRKNLDEAFVRRMHFMIEYPFPDEDDRFLIWSKVFPKDLPVGSTVDMRFMARQFKLSGGNIKNIGLAAAFLAAGDGAAAVEMEHLIMATRREYQKLGKLCTQSDFGPYFSLINEIEPKTRRAD